MKSKLILAIISIQLFVVQSHAIFVATLPIRLITGFKVSVSKEDKQKSIGGKLFKLVINIVFGIVGDDGSTVQVDEKTLADLGYSENEILEFKNKDIPQLRELSEKKTFHSMTELIQSINELKLGKIAQEQVRINIENYEE